MLKALMCIELRSTMEVKTMVADILKQLIICVTLPSSRTRQVVDQRRAVRREWYNGSFVEMNWRTCKGGGGVLKDLPLTGYERDDKEAADRRKLVSKWHATTKGTLKRSYRVPSKSEGRKLLKAIAALLSDDDHFVDAISHKGCQIRRESAHGESFCCNNVRALFDELPTPHLVVEITAFPAGLLSESDYTKAENLERVLRTGSSI